MYQLELCEIFKLNPLGVSFIETPHLTFHFQLKCLFGCDLESYTEFSASFTRLLLPSELDTRPPAWNQIEKNVSKIFFSGSKYGLVVWWPTFCINQVIQSFKQPDFGCLLIVKYGWLLPHCTISEGDEPDLGHRKQDNCSDSPSEIPIIYLGNSVDNKCHPLVF